MHTNPIPDSAGTFDEWKQSQKNCIKCGNKTVKYRVWESHCGGYEDEQFKCDCGHSWWVDGPDS